MEVRKEGGRVPLLRTEGGEQKNGEETRYALRWRVAFFAHSQAAGSMGNRDQNLSWERNGKNLAYEASGSGGIH